MRRAFARAVGLAGCALGAVSETGAAPLQNDLSCGVDLTVKDGHAQIRGVVTSRTGGRGTYRLVVRKSGNAGTSDLSQGGLVLLEPNGRAEVGQIALSVEGGARYEAILTLEVGGLRRECRADGQADLKI